MRHAVLDHGYVQLLDSMGNDLRIVNAAQASLGRFSAEFGVREAGILRKLMEEEHGVPFEHVVFTFQLRLPLFLAAQFKKHRHGSWSEHSARYSEMEPLFYVPMEVRRQVGSAMSYTYEEIEPRKALDFAAAVEGANWEAWAIYERALAEGVAKEQARLVLPVNLYTDVVWTLNLRSLFNFLRLRQDPHAQAEAYVYAEVIEKLAAHVVPEAMRLFVANGRPKP